MTADEVFLIATVAVAILVACVALAIGRLG